MTKTLPAEVEQQILARLENGDERDAIIFDLCESQNLDWQEAEAFADSIHAENADHIMLYHSPLLVALALATFLGGTGLIIYVIYAGISTYESIYWLHSQSPTGKPPTFGEVTYDFFFYLILTGKENLGLLILGMGMMVGSLRGMQDVWSALFAKWGLFQNIE